MFNPIFFARQFFADAYNLAVKEAGGEEFVLSAVLHADEKTKPSQNSLDTMRSIIIFMSYMCQ